MTAARAGVLGDHQHALVFVGWVGTEWQRVAFEGDLERWERGFRAKTWTSVLFYTDGMTVLPSGVTTRAATSRAFLEEVRSGAAALRGDEVLWIVLGNHGDREGDDQGHLRGVRTADGFVSADDLSDAIAETEGVVVVVAAHCAAAQFATMAGKKERVIVAAGCSATQAAPVREGYLEFLLWLGVPLFGLHGEALANLAPALATALGSTSGQARTLREAFDFANKHMPSLQPVAGQTYGPAYGDEPIHCTPVLCDPHELAHRVKL